VIAANPDVIVLADSKCCGQTARTVAARPGWSAIAAVRNRRVVAVDDDVASRWGPRIATFIRLVANAVARR
jgi:iron complex transport system substrate-binding protein